MISINIFKLDKVLLNIFEKKIDLPLLFLEYNLGKIFQISLVPIKFNGTLLFI